MGNGVRAMFSYVTSLLAVCQSLTTLAAEHTWFHIWIQVYIASQDTETIPQSL